MSWSGLVDRLAMLAGIEPWYYDIGGRRHATAEATKIAVLAALGFDVSSGAAIEAGIRAREEESWRRPMAPFVVRREDLRGIDVFLPASEAERHWEWEFAFEGGGAARESFRPQSLPLLDARDVDGRRVERRHLALDVSVPPGYHRFRLASEAAVESAWASVPASCYLPPVLADPGKRVWALSAHLYTLRSARNWGAGDFGDLATLSELAGSTGVSAIAVNPFHALFPGRPEDASPYSPSSRLFLNPIYIDPAAAPFAGSAPELQTSNGALARLRASDAVAYSAVWREKQKAFELLYRRWREQPSGAAPVQEFERFVDRSGPALECFATYSALAEEYGPAWQRWPGGLHAPGNDAVRAYARRAGERIAFHRFLQYLADRQLQAAAGRARDAGMAIGIVRDLALGANPDGADVWSQQESFAPLLRCGAPPDDFHSAGQEWGVLPAHPLGLRRNPAPFAALVAANMRHAGGLRIDHVVGLQRQFLVPLGAEPREGCYVRYPADELFGLIALESLRNRCLVVGEDLGTVPEGFRERMHEANLYGCALLYFERHGDGSFKAAHEYRVKAAAAIATHDLPTLAGFWDGRDIRERQRAGIYTGAEADAALAQRALDCRRLERLLAEAGLLSGGGANGSPAAMAALRNAVHGFLASSPAQIFLAQIDDLGSETAQINLPGTTVEHANWRRKLSLALEDPSLLATLRELARICRARGRTARAD